MVPMRAHTRYLSLFQRVHARIRGTCLGSVFFGLLLVGLVAGCGSGGDSSGGGTTAPTAQATAGPAIHSIPPTVAVVGKTLTYDVDALDADSPTLVYSLTAAPAGMSIVPATGVITWTPQATQVGDNTVSITASDGLNSRTQTFILAVFGVTQELASVPISSATGGTVTVNAPTSSLNGLTLTFSPNALPADATITVRELTSSPALPGGQLGGLRGFSLEPDGLVLNSPVTVTIPFDPANLNSGGGIVLPDFLGVFFLDPHTGQQVSQDTFRVDTVQNVLVGTLDHFSEWSYGPEERICPPPLAAGPLCPTTYGGSSSNYLPVLLVHGYGGDETTWGELPKMLRSGPEGYIEAWQFVYNSDVSFRKTSRALFRAISQVKRVTNQPAVNVVAHSFGGILARTYLQGMASMDGTGNSVGPLVPYQNDVNKLMTLGTPHRGIGGAYTLSATFLCQSPACSEVATGRPGLGALLDALNRNALPHSLPLLRSPPQRQYRVIIGKRFINGRRSDGLANDDGLITTAGADICAALDGGCGPNQIVVMTYATSPFVSNFALCHTYGVWDCAQDLNWPMAAVYGREHPSWTIIREFLTTDSPASISPPPAVFSTLTVSTPSNGTITSNPAGIQCGATCIANFENGTFVTLSPLPNSGFTFSGWSGACVNTEGPCNLAINGNTSVQANFTLQVTPPPPPPPSTSVNVTGTWQGTHTDNFVPTPQPITLNLTQTGTNVTGSWTSQLAGNGGDTASGTFTGNFTSGSIMTFVANQTSPVSCPGSFHGTATVNGNSMSATYSGSDCRGPISNGQVSVTKGTWSPTGSMATGRFGHTATLLPNGKVLVEGGINGGSLASAELYDPAANGGVGAWTPTGSLTTARYIHTATLLPTGKVLAMGNGLFSGSNSTELYDPAANGGAGAWSTIGSPTIDRYLHTATLLPTGKVLVVGGCANNSSTAFASAELYDPAANGGVGAWTPTGSLATARCTHTATLLPTGKVLVVGGSSAGDGLLASAELYDPAANGGVGAWTQTGSLATARQAQRATLLQNGKVLVEGGVVGLNGLPTASAELYDPAANGGVGAWTPTGSLATGRHSHTATLLPTGKVLVVGGSIYGGGLLASAELYDPAANGGVGAWTPTGSLATGRYLHTATLLPNGKVLAVGGSGNSFASAELFQ